MKIPQSIFLRAYGGLLTMYPEPFRAKYETQLLDAARLQHAEHGDHGKLAAALAWDTLKGAWRENMRFPGSTNNFSYLGFAALFTVLLLGLYVGVQQRWRRGANHAPQQIVEQLRAGNTLLLTGAANEISSPQWLRSGQAFAATYDAQGNVLASNARLHGALPQPPRGIFHTMQQRGSYRVTWQPEWGVRIALTGEPLANGGFAVAGQGLARSEANTKSMAWFLLMMWVFMMLGLGLSAGTRKTAQNHRAG
jgi:hypothetical protein